MGISLCYRRARSHSAVDQDYVKGLLINIHNAPTLRHLTLNWATLFLEDLETLHAATPILTSLALKYLRIAKQDAAALQAIVDPCNPVDQLDSLCLEFCVEENVYPHSINTERNDDRIFSKWILYMGKNINIFQKLMLTVLNAKNPKIMIKSSNVIQLPFYLLLLKKLCRTC